MPKVGTRSTEDTAAGAKRRKGQNGQSVPVKKTAAKKAAAAKKTAGARKTTTATKPAAKPAARKAVAKKPAAEKAAARKPVAKKPAAKEPVAKKPAAKKPAAKKEPKQPKQPKEPKEPSQPLPVPFLKPRVAPVHKVPEREAASGITMVFGNGDCGQLGLGDDMIERKKPFPVPQLESVKVVDLACGGLHTVALAADGQLWSWGCNDQKALGRDGDEFVAAPVQGLEGVRIAKVACSDSASFALGEDGHVYAWGTFRSAEGIMGFSASVLVQERPVVMNAFREPVVDLCAGVDHALALSASGKVYAWGYGQQGQLGRLVMERRRLHGLTPERLRLHDIHRIGCGSYHSFAVSKDGVVYAWGLNNFHQLGLKPSEGGSEEIVYEPTRVSALDGIGVAKISGGEHHTIALAADGAVYSFGRSDSHQTGLPFSTLPSDAPGDTDASAHKKAITVPTQITSLPPIADFACGSNHNIALSKDQKAYTWGYGEMLQLGNAEEEDVELPMLLEGKRVDDKAVLKVAAGGQHSVVLVA
ncbi:ran exchange factor Prp20/Pim1 [Coemansia mojavensis]|nr:ran exchange factor Prp20/Pim1 [Coemansia mojavensis]